MVENEYKIESIKMKARPIMLRVDSTAINLNSVETLRSIYSTWIVMQIY
jgi:hypothetical protein